MRLPVAMHLQAMLKDAQNIIGRGQGLRFLHRYRPRSRQRCQRIAGICHAQAGVATTMDQLMRLREKFAFPYAAMAALQVKAQPHFLPLGIMVADLCRHRGNILQLPEIQRLAPYERLDSVQEICAQGTVARTDA